MAERRLHGLQRVLGTNALFSTAYGNVGSSIYYALGLVASFALGLTPVVFIIAGVIFYLTAATYAEATAMYPEAGGSSSFARRAFNEFWSFFAAWGQMLNYVDHGRHLGVLRAALPRRRHRRRRAAPRPGRHRLRHRRRRRCCALVNVLGAEESAGLNIGLALADFATQLLLVLVGLLLVFSPDTLVDNVHLGVAPTWKRLLPRDPGGDDRLHRHRDDLEHGRGGQGRVEDDPRGDQARA